ncbi:MAG: hypothetical protein QM767_13090 [Anaeromyxobacter sp.]
MSWLPLLAALSLAAPAPPRRPAEPAPVRAEPPAVPRLDGIPSMVAAARWCQAPVRKADAVAWERLKVSSVCSILLQAPGNATAQDLIATLASRNRLSSECARRVLAATQLGWVVAHTENDLLASRAFVEAARGCPGNPAVLAEFMASGLPDRGTYLDALELAPDPAGLADQLLTAALPDLQEAGFGWVNALRAELLVRRKGAVAGAVASPDLPDQRSAYGWAQGTELDAVAVELTLLDRQRRAGAGAEEIAATAARALRAALPGWPLAAADIWGRLRPAERPQALAPLGADNLDLAAALLAFGAPADARAPWEAYLAAAEGTKDARRLLAAAVVRARVEDRRLDLTTLPGAGDTTELVAALGREGFGPEPLLPPATALAALPLLKDDPGLARTLLDDPGGDRGVVVIPPEPAEPSTVARLLPDARRALAALEQAQDRRVEKARAPLAAATPAEQRVTATVARLLRAPLPAPFTARPVPGASPRTLVVSREWLRAEPPRPPRGARPRFALELSGDPLLDGYHLVERGASGQPVRTFLGLRPGKPYVIAPDATPELTGGLLRIQATIEQIDDRPAGEEGPSPVRVRGGPVVLEASLDELRRDTDGDGLTDLAEAYLVTDPEDRDTDRDGVPDGADLLPQVPSAAQTPSGEAVTAALPLVFKGALRLGAVQGDRSAWRGVSPPSRALVLQVDELEQARQKLGWFERVALSPVHVAADGRSALVRYFGRSSGGSYILRRTATGWTATARGDWMK